MKVNTTLSNRFRNNLFILLALFSSISEAAITDSSKHAFDGYYIGANFGIEHTLSHYRFKDYITNVQPPMHIIDYSNPNIGETNYATGIILGGGKVFNYHNMQYYIGAEFAANYTPITIKNYGSSTSYFDTNQTSKMVSQDLHSVNFKNDYSLSAIAKMGLLLNSFTQAYVLVGVDDAPFEGEINARGQVLKSDNTYYVAAPYHHTFKKNNLGTIAGVGIESLFTKQLSIRAQYTFSFFENLKNSDESNIAYLDGSTLNQIKLKHNYQFKSISRGFFALSLIYHFLN